MDVNSAFLNGLQQEETYVTQPKGYSIIKEERYGLSVKDCSIQTKVNSNSLEHVNEQ